MSIAMMGFILVFVLSFWVSGLAGARWQSGLAAIVAGMLSFVVLLMTYVSVLAIWLRAQLIEFIKTEMPLILERLLAFADQVRILKESF
jgi:hypothetical protein